MYSLIITNDRDAWERARYRLSMQRYLNDDDYTNPTIRANFATLNAEVIRQLCSLPTLFMYELGVNRAGFLGNVTTVTSYGSGIEITFRVDRRTSLEWEQLDYFTTELGIIDREERKTTHWAIKDVDLRAVLEQAAPRVTSSVSFTPQRSPISPLSSHDGTERSLVSASIASRRFDVAIVCALHQPELTSITATGDQSWTSMPSQPDDPHTYTQTVYKTQRNTTLRVVAGAANQMGLSAAAVLATKMILRFRPKLVAMVGIAAGVNVNDQGFGDILAAEHTLDYGSGKISKAGDKLIFKADPKPIDIEPRLLARLKEWEASSKELDDIRRSWRGRGPNTVLKLHVGPLAAGAAVIDSREPIDRILEHWRKLIGVEMEAYAVHRACRDAVSPAPMFLALKSICDFALAKNDDWQHYAAFTAAEFCHRFLQAEWEDLYLG